MNRTRRLEPAPASAFGKCGLRRKCQNKVAFYYVAPTLTRSRNLSTRTLGICAECAETVRQVHPGIVG